MIRRHLLLDLSLGAVLLLLFTLLGWTALTRSSLPAVLAQSNSEPTCPAGSCSPGASREVSEGGYSFTETCAGYPVCNWNRQTIDPIVVTNNNYCCLSNGRTARCVILRMGEECVANSLETDVRLFSTESDNQRSCEIQRATGVCNPRPSSSSSFSSSSAASCGNNVRESANNEECDWGTNNSDTLPNRCRKNCKFPTCGDKRVDDNFSDPGTNTTVSEECDNIEYVVEGVQYPAVTDAEFALNRHTYCASNCSVKQQTLNPLFFMFPAANEMPVYFVRNIFDWNSIFFPLSSVGF